MGRKEGEIHKEIYTEVFFPHYIHEWDGKVVKQKDYFRYGKGYVKVTTQNMIRIIYAFSTQRDLN